jgi:CRISPR-associated protein Csh2
MSTVFNNRVFGCVIIKSINSSYNADFTKQPRLLPDGKAYATDKALKYLIRNFWEKENKGKVFYFKKFDEKLNPLDIDAAYTNAFPNDKVGTDKKIVVNNLLSCIDIKCFGATYANKKRKVSVSVHGPVQITHGVNRFPENIIFSEQIMSPFADAKEKKAEAGSKKSGDSAEYEDAAASTLGSQSKLKEGHYVHHFSINPKNIALFDSKMTGEEIANLKEGFCKGASYYQSSAKAGTDNELMLWVQLKEESTIILPSFVEMIEIGTNRVIDLKLIKEKLATSNIKNEIEKIELYYCKTTTTVINAPEGADEIEL